MAKYKQRENVCAIFLHGGAGCHNPENEHKHLEALGKAAEAAMIFLKNGATAVQAVEVAIMVLEDEPILNAGVGSSLNIRGRVECDASIVDHFGRSGAAGAVPGVKNPIMLARKIYDEASVDPGGGRINPNFLAGQGATDYAWTHGVVVVTDSHLITEAARARWQSWCREVQEYEDRHPRKPSGEPNPWLRRPPIPLSTIIERLMGPNDDKDKAANPATATPDTDLADTKQAKGEKTVDGQLPQVKVEDAGEGSSASPKVESASQKPDESQSSAAAKMAFDGEDNISDTVGAIAIDKYGNIAAGSSSGGMAMKPRGRVGPAALIGIGTHVIPVDPTDPEHTTVAAVTSGTGEQLATTFAASTCASRIYYSQKMGNAGVFEQVTEEEALSSTIQREFLRHPSCLNSEIYGCMGVMAAKKNDDGIALYFAHTTASFALASMCAYDDQPRALMSRNETPGHTVAQGGLMFRGKKVSDCSKDDTNKKPKTSHE